MNENENVSDDGYAIDIEDNEDTQSEQNFVLDDNIDDEPHLFQCNLPLLWNRPQIFAGKNRLV